MHSTRHCAAFNKLYLSSSAPYVYIAYKQVYPMDDFLKTNDESRISCVLRCCSVCYRKQLHADCSPRHLILRSKMAFEIVVAAVLFAATFLYYLTAIRNSKVNKFLKLVSGPPQLPLLGNMLDFNIPNDGKIERDFCYGSSSF